MEAKMNQMQMFGEEREIRDRIDVKIFDQYKHDKSKLFDMTTNNNYKSELEQQKIDLFKNQARALQEASHMNDLNRLEEEL